MPSINDLKKNNVNMSRVTPNNSDDVMIDFTSNENLDSSIKRNDENYANRPKGKTVIEAPKTVKGPDGSIYRINTPKKSPSEDRVAFDLTKVAQTDASENEDIHTSIQDDILSGKNPILYNYIAEKKQEMEQWVEQKNEELAQKRLEDEAKQIENEEVSIDLTTNTGNVEVETSTAPAIDNMDNMYNDSTDDSNVVYKSVDDDIFNEIENSSSTIKENNFIPDDYVEITNDENYSDINAVDDINEEITDEDIKDNSNDVDIDVNTGIVSPVVVENKVDNFVSSEGVEIQDNTIIKVENEDGTPVSDDDEASKLAAERIAEEATKKLKPISKRLDLSSFTVVKKPASTSSLMNQKEINVAKWVLRHKKTCIQMKASVGSEMEELRVLLTDASSASDFIRLYRIIYDHVVSPKPKSFEAWCKSTYTEDLDDYFFCYFIANYKGSNYIPYDCTNKECKPGTFLSDNIPIMDMVKFGSDKDKEEFSEIYRSERFELNEDGLYPVERIPFSEKIAMEFKEATLFSFIEAQTIRSNDAFINKYATTITIAPNIDKMYTMDIASKTLQPIEYKEYPESNANTYKSKIQKYDSIIKTLSPDEFATLSSYMTEFLNDTSKSINIKYIRPAIKCPDCGAEIPESDTTGQALVFFRYQLGQMVNTSTK